MKNTVTLFCALLLGSYTFASGNTPTTETVNDTPVAENAPEVNEMEIYVKIQKKAEFVGGTPELVKFLRENLTYPNVDGDEQGTVIVEFTVEKDGSISNPTIIRSVHELFDAEALRVVSKMPKWIPASHNGKVVRSKFRLPISFKLSN